MLVMVLPRSHGPVTEATRTWARCARGCAAAYFLTRKVALAARPVPMLLTAKANTLSTPSRLAKSVRELAAPVSTRSEFALPLNGSVSGRATGAPAGSNAQANAPTFFVV